MRKQVAVCTHPPTHTTHGAPGGTAGQEHHLILSLVVEEVVERPQAPILAVGVRVQVRAVTEEKH